jgi:hypothetical protein
MRKLFLLRIKSVLNSELPQINPEIPIHFSMGDTYRATSEDNLAVSKLEVLENCF